MAERTAAADTGTGKSGTGKSGTGETGTGETGTGIAAEDGAAVAATGPASGPVPRPGLFTRITWAFQNLSVVQKLLMPLALLAVMGLALSLYALSQMRVVGDEYQSLLQRESHSIAAILRANETAAHIGRLSYMMVAEPDSFILESLGDEIALKQEQFLDHLRMVETLLPGLAPELAKARADLGLMMDHSTAARTALLDGRREEGASILVDRFDIKLVDLLDRLSLITADVDRTMKAGEEAAGARYGRALWITLAVGASGTLLVMVLALVLTVGAVSRPLKRIVATMTRIAEGDVDMHIRGQARRDEIGEIARALSVFQNGLKHNLDLQQQKEEADRRTAGERRRALAEFATDLEQAVLSVAETVARKADVIARQATEMGNVGESGANRSLAAAAAAEQAAQQVMTLAMGAESVLDTMRDAQRRVLEAASIAEAARAGVDRTEVQMRTLSEAVERIGHVLSMISEIAEQTNLLALNATIEAARAGEAGKGFAVVAGEVKNLAGQTGRATVDIRSQIDGIRDATADAVATIQEVTRTVRRIADLSGEVNSAIDRQGESVNSMMTTANTVAETSATFSEQFANVAMGAARSQAGIVRVIWGANDLRGPVEHLRDSLDGFLARLRA